MTEEITKKPDEDVAEAPMDQPTGGLKKKPKRSSSRSFKTRERIFIVLMLAFPVIQWIVFWLTVNISSISLAFADPRTGAFTWKNFADVWEQLTAPYGTIKIALTNTLEYFAVQMLVTNTLSLVIAYFLYKKIAMYKAFRIFFYLPAIITALAMVTVFSEIIAPGGLLGQFMKAIGHPLPPEGLLARSDSATHVIVFYTVWTGMSTNIMLFSGAMARVPVEILESAKLDGCSPAREFFQLILPLIAPTITTVVILSFTSIFTATGPILLFKGGPSETTISYWIFEKIYGNGALGGGSTELYNIVSCTGLCFTVIGVPIILLVRWAMSKIPTVEY